MQGDVMKDWVSCLALEMVHFNGYPSMQGQVFIKTDLHGSVTAFSKRSPR